MTISVGAWETGGREMSTVTHVGGLGTGETRTMQATTHTPRPTRRRRPPTALVVVLVTVVGLPLLALGGYAAWLTVSGTPLIDEWQCAEGEAPVETEGGGSYCEAEGATLPEGDTWHPLGNRPYECTDRWGWVAVYTTWEPESPHDPGYEVGCLREGSTPPPGWTYAPDGAGNDYVPAG